MNGDVAIRTFKDLIVWQKAFDLAVEIYRLSGEFPKHELYGLSSELAKPQGRSCTILPKGTNEKVRVNTSIFSGFRQGLPPNWNLRSCCQKDSDIFRKCR